MTNSDYYKPELQTFETIIESAGNHHLVLFDGEQIEDFRDPRDRVKRWSTLTWQKGIRYGKTYKSESEARSSFSHFEEKYGRTK